MLPELFRIPFLNLPVHTYGVLLVTGLMVGMFIAYRQARLRKKYYDDVLDFAFWALIGALLGARILFIIVEAQYYFVDNPFTQIPGTSIYIPSILALWTGGFVFWGGAIGGAITLVLFCKKRGIPLAHFADICVLGLPIGHAIGRIGCVAGGCCYGYSTYHLDHAGNVVKDMPFALSFPKGSIAFGSLYNEASGKTLEIMQKLSTTVPLFPVQIMESLGNIVIFFILLFFTTKKRAHGQVALAYFILYSIMRSITEEFRGDKARGFVFDGFLSTSQLISLVVIAIALILMVMLSKRSKKLVMIKENLKSA